MWEGARRCLLCDQDRRNLRPATLDLRGDPGQLSIMAEIQHHDVHLLKSWQA